MNNIGNLVEGLANRHLGFIGGRKMDDKVLKLLDNMEDENTKMITSIDNIYGYAKDIQKRLYKIEDKSRIRFDTLDNGVKGISRDLNEIRNDTVNSIYAFNSSLEESIKIS